MGQQPGHRLANYPNRLRAPGRAPTPELSRFFSENFRTIHFRLKQSNQNTGCAIYGLLVACCGLSRLAAACCSLPQLAAACCNLLRLAAACRSLPQLAAACCILLQLAAACRGLLQLAAAACRSLLRLAAACAACNNLQQLAAACCSLPQLAASCCSLPQLAAACCSLLRISPFPHFAMFSLFHIPSMCMLTCLASQNRKSRRFKFNPRIHTSTFTRPHHVHRYNHSRAVGCKYIQIHIQYIFK